ncbi:cytochrome P450 [Pluteus cervinus]|uniref:Cytochrome P450 n=1 Tax=Pluteus cervinus TaxID=181527 RepID=A0ACD3BEJ6_9AGAR|nr:cytochrome P450 [Pluteus cervinus]
MNVQEDLQLPYTMNKAQMENTYHSTVVRTDLTRAIPNLIPEIIEESVLTMEEGFQFTKEKKEVTIPLFDTMTHFVARISNRALLGPELGRNKDFVHAVVRFAETTPLMAPFICWSPHFLRSTVYFVLSSFLGGKKGALKFVVPHLEEYMKEREFLAEKPGLLSEFLIRNAPPNETVEGVAMRALNMNFGSIHTSSIFVTHTLFELALLPTSQVDEIREEVIAALDSEGGWTKNALLKFRKIDSLLREVGRVYGLMHFALPRISMVPYQLDDGNVIPPGYRVAIDMKAIHYNAKVYPDPFRFDPFRFSKLRETESTDTKYGFATVDSNYLPFGAGRHACAGRFFAAMELKVMVAHILLKYNFKYTEPRTVRPKNLQFNGAVVPDPKVHMTFWEREEVSPYLPAPVLD